MRHRISVAVEGSRLLGQGVSSCRKHNGVGGAGTDVGRGVVIRKGNGITKSANFGRPLRTAYAIAWVGCRASVIRQCVGVESISRSGQRNLRGYAVGAEHH